MTNRYDSRHASPEASTDLYPIVMDLSEAEYGGGAGFCCFTESFGNFSLEDLITPNVLPLNFGRTAAEESGAQWDERSGNSGGKRTAPRGRSNSISNEEPERTSTFNGAQSRKSLGPFRRDSSLLCIDDDDEGQAPEMPGEPDAGRRSRASPASEVGVESSVNKDSSVSLCMETGEFSLTESSIGFEEADVDNSPRFEQSYAIVGPILRCAVSTVWECVHRETKERRCVKIVDRRRFTRPDDEEATNREVAMMQYLAEYKFQYVTTLVQVFKDRNQVYIVMEYVDGMNLLSRLYSRDLPPLSEFAIKMIARSLLEGVQQLHSLNICHHDLREENLILVEGRGLAEVKICDFGNAIRSESDSTCCDGRYGCLTHAAPEILRRRKHTTMSDMWSVGVILYRCFSGELPFVDTSKSRLKEKIVNAEYNFEKPAWSKVSRRAKQFISNLLQADPNVRSTPRDALDHFWLADRPKLVPPPSPTSVVISVPLSPAPRSPPPTKKSSKKGKKVLGKLGAWLSHGSTPNSPNTRDTPATHENSSVSTFSTKASTDRSPAWRRRKLFVSRS